jgi:hypothetical protein
VGEEKEEDNYFSSWEQILFQVFIFTSMKNIPRRI